MHRLNQKIIDEDYEEVYVDTDHTLHKKRNHRILVKSNGDTLEYNHITRCNQYTGYEQNLRQIIANF